MKRSTNRAPVALSTSYLIGSAFMGISMMTLISSGASSPGPTRSRFMFFNYLAKKKKGRIIPALLLQLQRDVGYLYEWNNQQRDDIDDLDKRIDRRTRGVLVRITDGVAGYR